MASSGSRGLIDCSDTITASAAKLRFLSRQAAQIDLPRVVDRVVIRPTRAHQVSRVRRALGVIFDAEVAEAL